MSLDGIGQFGSGTTGSSSGSPTTRPAAHRHKPADVLDVSGTVSRTVHTSTQDQQNASVSQVWHDKALVWGSRNALGEAINHIGGVNISATALGAGVAEGAASMGFNTQNVTRNGYNYSRIFQLGQQGVQGPKNWQNYRQAVRNNFSNLNELASGRQSARSFFEGFSPKRFLKETVWENNTRPISNWLKSPSRSNLGAGLTQSLGVGLMGWDVFKNTHQAYKQAKQQEDGSFSGKLNTVKQTAVAFGKYSVRDVGSWEVAGAALAFGRAVLPFTVGRVPVAGIALGALAGAFSHKALGKAMNIENGPTSSQSGQSDQSDSQKSNTSQTGQSGTNLDQSA